MRKCYWCGRKYDAHKESSIYCEKNPHRGRGKNRLTNNKPKVYTFILIPANATESEVKRIVNAAA
jgi:hypothetical protein